MKKGFFYAILALIAVSCSAKSEQHDAVELTPAEKNVEAMANYWNKFNFADTTWLAHEKELEQVFAVWVEGVLAAYYDCDTILTGDIAERASVSKPMFKQFMHMADECFRNPNSPWRCEELYIPILEKAVKIDGVDDAEKLRWNDRLEKAKMNRFNTIATDFDFRTDKGTTGSLHGIDTQWVLLYFFNPGCHDCERVSGVIKDSPIVQALIDCNALTVLALYPDEDLAEWNKHRGEFPKEWTVARYADQSESEKYDLPAIPNLYLLDRDKRVVVKDGNIEDILYILENMWQ
ncbi:MAG: DUF5106 domain-containing protein [Muribaculaceae bacterium]|nr:DUF5106 domain-containing protein [Muribaculaceae bacterium]